MNAADLDRLLKEAPGFGRCPRCPYLTGGSVALCFRCARRTMEPLADPTLRCEVCDQTFPDGSSECGNPVCRMDEDDRYFIWNFAIAMRTRWLKTAINDYKYNGRRAWAAIFGRILIGFLGANEVFKDIEVDLIVGNPAYTGPGATRSWDHVHEILAAADREQDMKAWIGGWELDLEDPPAVIKTAATPSMVDLGTAAERRRHAQTTLRGALVVPDPGRTRGKTIVVFDDVFTGGWTLREVARALIVQGGAAAVYGVSLSRQPFSAR
jgi:predicted amidophosphoribosyltransferase